MLKRHLLYWAKIWFYVNPHHLFTVLFLMIQEINENLLLYFRTSIRISRSLPHSSWLLRLQKGIKVQSERVKSFKVSIASEMFMLEKRESSTEKFTALLKCFLFVFSVYFLFLMLTSQSICFLVNISWGWKWGYRTKKRWDIELNKQTNKQYFLAF